MNTLLDKVKEQGLRLQELLSKTHQHLGETSLSELEKQIRDSLASTDLPENYVRGVHNVLNCVVPTRRG